MRLTVPSREHDLHLHDVAGFGDASIDPYRQSLVAQAVQASCSTMVLMLHWRRMGGNNAHVPQMLKKVGIYGQLLLIGHQRESVGTR